MQLKPSSSSSPQKISLERCVSVFLVVSVSWPHKKSTRSQHDLMTFLSLSQWNFSRFACVQRGPGNGSRHSSCSGTLVTEVMPIVLLVVAVRADVKARRFGLPPRSTVVCGNGVLKLRPTTLLLMLQLSDEAKISWVGMIGTSFYVKGFGGHPGM